MNISFIKVYLLFSVTFIAPASLAYQLEDLMTSPQFKHDQVLADGIQTALNEFAPLASYIASNGHRHPHVHMEKQMFAQFWQDAMKDECQRLINTYGQAMHESDFNDANFLEVYNRFRDQFNDQAITQCKRFETKITDYLNQVDETRSLPAMINRYQQALDTLVAGSTLANIRAFADQTTQRYTQRLNNQMTIQTHLAWIKAYQPKHPKLDFWQQQFKDLNLNYQMIARSAAKEIIMKSKFPLDYYADDKPDEIQAGNQVRDQIKNLMKQQFDLTIERVILRDSGFKPARKFIKQGSLISLQNYQAIPFVAVLANSNTIFSTHRGWYEKKSSSDHAVYLLNNQQNFESPRIDQLVQLESIYTPNKQKISDITHIENPTAAVDNNPNSFYESIGSNQYTEEFNFLSFIIGLFTAATLMAGGLILSYKIWPKVLPINAMPVINKVYTWITPLTPLTGLILVSIGLFQLVQSLTHFSPSYLVVSFLSIMAGCLLLTESATSKLSNLKPIRQIKNQLDTVANHTPLANNLKPVIGLCTVMTSIYYFIQLV